MVLVVFGIAVVLAFLNGCATCKRLTATMGTPQVYRDKQGDCFVARYGQLSDHSLYFVKITIPDGRHYTLPQVLSASGVRYTDERELVWWEHQGTIRVDIRGADGQWVTKYPALKLAPITK